MKKKLNARTVNALSQTGERYRVWDSELIGFHVRVSPVGKRTYSIAYRHEGLSKEVTVGVHGSITADEARELAKTHMGLIAKGEDVQADKKARKAKAKMEKFHTLGIFIKGQYQPWAQRELSSAQESMRTLNRDFGYLYSRKMKDITPWVIESWSKQAHKKGLTPSTINRRVATLKSVLSKAVLWNVIDYSPLKGMKQLKTDKNAKVRYLTESEETRLRQALLARQENDRNARNSHNEWLSVRHKKTFVALGSKFTDYLMPLVIVALNTGLRRGELFNLVWSDIDLKDKRLTVQGQGSKSGNTRYIPLNDEALSTLKTWCKETESRGLVFPSPVTGKRLDNVRKSWGGVIGKAKIPKFRLGNF